MSEKHSSFSFWLKRNPAAESYRVSLGVVKLLNPPHLRDRLVDMVREAALAEYRKTIKFSIKEDPLERVIAEALSKNGVPFTRDNHSQEKGVSLDFVLPCNVGIEVKRYFCGRTSTVLEKNKNVILVQGQQAAESFSSLINRGQDLTLKALKQIQPSYSVKVES